MASKQYQIYKEDNELVLQISGIQVPDNKLNDLLDMMDAGRLSKAGVLDEIRELIAKYPNFIDGYAHVAGLLFEQGEFEKATEQAKIGYEKVLAFIPDDWTGKIIWGSLDNRPFLRCAHTYGLCLQKLHKDDEANAVFNRILAWNPNDNQGIRFLVEDASTAPKP